MNWIVPGVIGVATLTLMWIMLRQKVGVDTVTLLRADLTRAQDELSRVAADNEQCKAQQEVMRSRYEQIISDLRSENLSLMREALGMRGRRRTENEGG